MLHLLGCKVAFIRGVGSADTCKEVRIGVEIGTPCGLGCGEVWHTHSLVSGFVACRASSEAIGMVVGTAISVVGVIISAVEAAVGGIDVTAVVVGTGICGFILENFD
jgi:hypothetical protein